MRLSTEAGLRAELVIIGRVATLAGPRGWGWVEALAVGGGRVMAAGPRGEVLALAGPATVTWRLGDRAVIPGITDAHLHLASAALAAAQLDLTGLDLPAALDVVAAAHQRLLRAGNVDGWLLGHGWSVERIRRAPAAGDLDAVVPGRPVALWAHDHHARWLSSAAMRQAGLGEAIPDPPGGHIGRDEAGRPAGLFLEAAAVLVDRAIPEPDAKDLERALMAFSAGLAGLGVVGLHDPGEVAPDPDLRRGPLLYRRLAAEGRLPLRVAASVRREQLDAALAAGFRTGRGVAGPAPIADRYRDGWLKLFADGSLGSRTAALLDPYEPGDPHGLAPGGPSGMLTMSAEEVVRVGRHAAAAGIALQVHGIGDRAVRVALDALGTLPRPAGGIRHRVEHAQLVHPDDVARFAELGVAASVQPCHLLSDAPAARAAWGERSGWCFPLGSLDRAGALMPFGTDAPVEPPDPWPGIAAAVTRRGPGWASGEVFHAEQAVPLERALRAACLDAPTSLGVGDQGHLGPGARADLLVLPAAALDVEGVPVADLAGRLARTRPLASLIDGRVAFRDPGFDP